MTKEEREKLVVLNEEMIASWPEGYAVITVVCRPTGFADGEHHFETVFCANLKPRDVVTVLEWAIEDARNGGQIAKTR